ncbi:MAG: glycosyltransferase [Clostridia bacterium]|nr:glycosyltransferase [Clostridia bacterium]
MKKILFVMSQFNMGGIEKELLCLLNTIDRNKYTADLYLTSRGGQLESEIPEHVTVHYPQSDVIGCLISLIKKGKFLAVVKKCYYYLRCKLSKGCEKDYWAVKVGARLQERYDCVIAYDGLDMAVIGMAEEIHAGKRLLWEHGPLIGVDKDFIKRSKIAAKRFDKIVCVSEALKREFTDEYQLQDKKACVQYNLINVPELLKKSEVEIFDMNPPSGKIIVTVGRLHPQKGQEIIPQITRKLIDAGYDIYWYLVGDGILREKIETSCCEYDVRERVILLGNKNNPFPYIKNCDIYVQTSSWEGWGLTIQEARILCKPMVVTPLPVVYEQVTNGENGLIAKDMTSDAMYESIKLLLENLEMQNSFVAKLEKEKYKHLNEIQKLYDIINN